MRHPDTSITNWTQVLELAETGGTNRLLRLEDLFRQFGTNAGFENSILEKYVLTPPGIEVTDGLGGELVLLSAQPFPDISGEPHRAFVAKMPDGRYRSRIISESRVQRIVAAAGQTIPKPQPSEPLPRPSNDEIRQQLEQRRKFRDEGARMLREYLARQQASNQAADPSVPSPDSLLSPPRDPLAGTSSPEPASRNALWPLAWVGLALLTAAGLWWRARR